MLVLRAKSAKKRRISVQKAYFPKPQRQKTPHYLRAKSNRPKAKFHSNLKKAPRHLRAPQSSLASIKSYITLLLIRRASQHPSHRVNCRPFCPPKLPYYGIVYMYTIFGKVEKTSSKCSFSGLKSEKVLDFGVKNIFIISKTLPFPCDFTPPVNESGTKISFSLTNYEKLS